MLYNIKITLSHKTINHNNIKSLSKCYDVIMNTYRHLKESNINTFSISLWTKDGRLMRLTNKHLLGYKHIQKEYINYKLIN